MGIDNQQRRLDTLETDKKADQKISLVKGKEGELTKAYISKVDDFQSKIRELPVDKREGAKQSVFSSLRSIDATNLETKKTAFNQKIDEFMKAAEEQKAIRTMVESISEPAWTDLGPGHLFGQLYKNLVDKGYDISKKEVSALSSYVQQSGRIAAEYREHSAYFLEDKKPILADDKTLKLFINGSIVAGILTNKLTKPEDLSKAFKNTTEAVKKKKEECMEVQSVLKEMANGKAAEALANDRGKVIEVFAVLSEKNGISPKTIGAVLKKVIYSEEFAPLAETGWSNAEEFKLFVIETVLRGGLKGKVENSEIDQIKAELYVKNLYVANQNLFEAKIQANTLEGQNYQTNQNSFKRKYAREGRLYAYCLPDKEMASSTNSENNRGNFSNLLANERDYAVVQANNTALRIQEAKNNATYLIAIQAMSEGKTLDEMKKIGATIFANPYENLKSQYAGIIGGKTTAFTTVEALRAGHQIEKNNSEEKAAIVNNKNLLTGELIYRQMLEGGEPIENEVVKNAVLARKNTRLGVLKESSKRINDQIVDSASLVEEAIAKYGSINLVPASERLIITNKARTLLDLLNVSHQYNSQISGINTEVKLLAPEKGLTKEEETFHKQNSIEQKKLYEDLSGFLTGEEETLPDPDISSPEIQALMLGQLQGSVSDKVGSAVDGLVKTSQSVSHFFGVQVKSKTYNQLTGGPVTILQEGVKKTDAMLASIYQGRAQLMNAKTELLNSLNNPPPAIKDNPKLLKDRKKLVDSLIKGIQAIIDSRFSTEQEQQVLKIAVELRDKIDDAFWDVVKFTAIFAATIATALLTGGLAAAGAGRLVSVARFGQSAHKIATFTAGNIGVATASTFVPRAVTEVTNELDMGSKWQVDWSAEGMAKDFGLSLGMSMGFSGAGLLLGEKLAIRTAIKQGGNFTYKELTEAGVTKLGALQKMLNPLAGEGGESKLAKTVLNRLKVGGRDFMQEMVEEAGQEFGDAIDPRLGGFMALVSAANGPDVSLDMKAKISTSLENMGVTFNQNLNQLEYTQSSAKEFGIDLITKLGDAQHQLEMSVNQDGSFSMRIKGTNEVFKINPPATDAEMEAAKPKELTSEEIAAQVAEDQEITEMIKEIKSFQLRRKAKKIYDNLYKNGATISEKGFEWTAKALKASKKGLESAGAYGVRFFKILDSKLMEVGKMRDFGSIIQDIYESAIEAGTTTEPGATEVDEKSEEKTALGVRPQMEEAEFGGTESFVRPSMKVSVEDRTGTFERPGLKAAKASLSAEMNSSKTINESDSSAIEPLNTFDSKMSSQEREYYNKHLRELIEDDANAVRRTPKEELKTELKKYAEDQKNGIDNQTQLGKILNNLKKRDPEGFTLLMNNNMEQMIDSEVLHGIVGGAKNEIVDHKGKKVLSYTGKYLKAGGMGSIHKVGYAVEGQDQLQYAVIKISHRGKEKYFKEEVSAAMEIEKWSEPSLIKSLHINEQVIIYETAETTMDLTAAKNKMGAVAYLDLLNIALDGIQAYQDRGKFHGDLKEANILLLKSGVDREGYNVFEAKIIDNSALPFHFVLESFPTTRGYGYTVEEIEDAAFSEVSSRSSSVDDIALTLSRAFDNKSVGKILGNTIRHYGLSVEENSELGQILTTLRTDPIESGKPEMLGKIRREIEKLAGKLEKEEKSI